MSGRSRPTGRKPMSVCETPVSHSHTRPGEVTVYPSLSDRDFFHSQKPSTLLESLLSGQLCLKHPACHCLPDMESQQNIKHDGEQENDQESLPTAAAPCIKVITSKQDNKYSIQMHRWAVKVQATSSCGLITRRVKMGKSPKNVGKKDRRK